MNPKLFSGRGFHIAAIVLTLPFVFITPSFLRAQDAAAVAAQMPDPSPTSAAIQVDSKKSSWLDDLLAKGSPLHAGLIVGETYDDNIFITPQKTSDFITHISPTVDFQKGDMTAPHSNYFNAYFAPTLFLYTNHPEQNRHNFNADVYYQYQWTRLALGIEQQYLHLTDPTIDIGGLPVRDIYVTALNGSYIYNDKLILYAAADQRITSYPSIVGVDTNEWSADAFALYQVAPKLQLGAGPRIVFVDILGAPNEAHQNLLMHLNYNPGGKISLTFAAGLEYLEFQGNSPSHLLPIFDLAARYNPRDGTTVSLTASRQSVNSYDLRGEVYLDTIVDLTFRQRFLDDTYFTLSGGFESADYEFGSADVSGPKRNDNYFFANVGVEWDPKEWLKFNANYQRSEDDSSFVQNSFHDNQINIQAAVNF